MSLALLHKVREAPANGLERVRLEDETVTVFRLAEANERTAKCCVTAARWLTRHRAYWGDRSVCGFVYFAQVINRSGETSGKIKIGYSDDPMRRLYEHRRDRGPMVTLLVIPGSPELERRIHECFRLDGDGNRVEWFEDTPSLRASMRWLKKGLKP